MSYPCAPEEVDYCPDCDSQLSEDGSCPECLPPEISDEATDGCPICGSGSFTVESGDLVSCGDCGNVYIRKEYGGAEQSWKWKFWVGLVFIVVGDIGIALGSYVHNVLEWSPLGSMYLGYGFLDQLVGIVGIVLFVVGLILFAWSFKREREVQCPSCKVIVLEEQLTEAEEEEEDIIPEELAVESALEEIDSKPFPNGFTLNQNYPNPFNPNTKIEFSIQKSAFVTLKIYNLLGQEVATLVTKRLTPGNYKYTTKCCTGNK